MPFDGRDGAATATAWSDGEPPLTYYLEFSFFGDAPDPPPEELAALVPRGLDVVALCYGHGRDLTEARRRSLAPLLVRWRTQLCELGLAEDAVVLLADEPTPDQAVGGRAAGEWIKSQFPETKLWIGTRPSPPWDGFADLFDTITAASTGIYATHSHDETALRRWLQVRPAGEYWWFHSVEPYAPYANLRLDDLPIEARVAGWQSAQAAVDGYEYFWIADWRDNADSAEVPWPERARRWRTGLSGAGTLCYPDEHGLPMPSLRLVNLRDGFEDWALLEQAAPRHRTLAAFPGLRDVTRTLADFTTDPETLLRARAALIASLGPVAK